MENSEINEYPFVQIYFNSSNFMEFIQTLQHKGYTITEENVNIAFEGFQAFSDMIDDLKFN